MLKHLVVAAVVALLGPPVLRADHVLFSVRNDTTARWELVDRTRRGEGVWPAVTDVGPGGGGGSPWILEPGGSLTFLGEGFGCLPVEIGLRPGVGNLLVPCAKAALVMPLAPASAPEDSRSGGEPPLHNRFCITAEGRFQLEGLKLRPLKPARSRARIASTGTKRAREEAKVCVPEILPPRKKAVVDPSLEGLVLDNASDAPWTLAVEDRPVEVRATLRPLSGTREGAGKAAVSLPRKMKTGLEHRFLIPPRTRLAFAFPGPAGNEAFSQTARLLDSAGRNPKGCRVVGEFWKVDSAELHYSRPGRPAEDRSPVALREGILVITGKSWTDLAPSASPVGTPPAADPAPEPKAPILAALVPAAPDASPIPPSARMVSPASSSSSAGTATEALPPAGRALPTALRLDMADSAMFLGLDEGEVLARHLGISADVLAAFVGPSCLVARDDRGLTMLRTVSRLNGAGPVPANPEGLVLLHLGRHFTVLRPTAPGEQGRFLGTQGETYVEATREGRSPGTRVPAIASDGHCLVASLHYLKHGQVPTPEAVWAHRRQIAADLSPQALDTLVTELPEEIIRGSHPLLATGCFSGLGPRLSLLLQMDPGFMERYQNLVRSERQALEAMLSGQGGQVDAAPLPTAR